jgi:hypothetical protein
VTSRYPLQPAAANQAMKKVQPGVTARLLEIVVTGADVDIFEMKWQRQPGGDSPDELGIGSRLVAAQLMIDVKDLEVQVPPRRQFKENVKQAD